MIAEAIGMFIAGLGFFFVGVNMLSQNLKETSNMRFKHLLARWTRNPLLSGLWGFVSGAITQTSSGVAFVLVGLNSSKLLNLRTTLSIINWANIGTSALVFFVALNIKIGILFLIGLAGILLALGPASWRKVSAILFGIGILFFGLLLLKQNSGLLIESDSVKALLAYIKRSLLLAFAAGAVLRLIAQSSSAVSVIAITMAGSGLFNTEQTMMIIFGTNLGSGISTYFLASGLKGTGRQIALFQVMLNTITALLALILMYVEIYTSIPLLKAFLADLTPDIEQQMAYAFLATKILGGLLIIPFYGLSTEWLARIVKDHGEDIIEMKYLTTFSDNDPDTATELIKKEQARIVNYFTVYTQQLRLVDESEGDRRVKLNSLIANNSVSSALEELQDYISDLIGKNLDHNTSEKLMLIQKMQQEIVLLNQILLDFVGVETSTGESERLKALSRNMIEGTDTIILTLIACLESEEVAEIDMLLTMTSNNSELVKNLRRSYLQNQDSTDEQEMFSLYMKTNTLERFIWIVNNLASILKDYRSEFGMR